jgi:hypothetical protein
MKDSGMVLYGPWPYHSVINVCLEGGKHDLVFKFFEKLINDEIHMKPDKMLLQTMIELCYNLQKYDKMFEIYEYVSFYTVFLNRNFEFQKMKIFVKFSRFEKFWIEKTSTLFLLSWIILLCFSFLKFEQFKIFNGLQIKYFGGASRKLKNSIDILQDTGTVNGQKKKRKV